ncbi:ubinuclein-1-like isoform X2 [Argopecten irradians]|uniref:ubinuclein-1-like isoform X2 n=1 Tax=Argopecten irradians TaxID=31199 RepID=UPI003716168F
MAEPRRLQFTTLDNKKETASSETPVCTARFVLSLKESTDETCSEFSYTELLKKHSSATNGVQKERSSDDGTDKPKNDLSGPFGDEDDPDEVAAIARQFEEKYGPKPGTKKPVVEMIDLGEGYDENDPFIDNSEAYDELVPSTLTTRLGGFYINSGKLEFRELSDDSMDAFQKSTPLQKKRKKQVIASDSESEKEEKTKENKKVVIKMKKRKIKDGIEGEEKKRKKKKLLNGEGVEKSFKKPKKPEEKEKLKKKKLSPTVGELLKQQTQSTATPTSVTNYLNSDSQESNDSSQDGKPEKLFPDNVTSNSKEDSNSREAGETKSVDPSQIPKLPQGLPQPLIDTIEKLKEAAKHSQDGKCKFFSNDVNSMLLKVELHCRQLPWGHRTTIYAHLASFLPCGKETLQKRAKKLRISQQDDVVREPLQKLRDAVNAVMPSMWKRHEEEYQSWVKQKREAEAAEGNKEVEKEKEEKEKNNSDDSDEEKGPEATGGKKRTNGPRKKFEWTENIRNLLFDVVRCKMKLCELAKNKTETNEEYLKTFLENEVKPLWPKGWMQTRMLFKESRSVHSSWTNLKHKKTVILTKSLPGSASNTPTTSQAATKLGTDVTPSRPKDSNSVLLPTSTSASNVLDFSRSNSTTPTLAVNKKPGTTTSGTPNSNSFTTSPGLSLLADSAASARSIDMPPERSWDHVVSDILKSSFIPSPSSKDMDKSAISPDSKVKATGAGQGQDQGASGAGFLAQFQKYASEVFASKLKESEPGSSASATSPQKQQPQQPRSNITQQQQPRLTPTQQQQPRTTPTQQQQQPRSNLTQQQKQLVQKIQVAASQRQDKPNPTPAHQATASLRQDKPSPTPAHQATASLRHDKPSPTLAHQSHLSTTTKAVPNQYSSQQKTSARPPLTPQQMAAISVGSSLTPQQKAALQSATHSLQTKSPTLGQQTSATMALHRSLLNDEVYRQLLEGDKSQASKSMSVSSKPSSTSSMVGQKQAKVITTKTSQPKTVTKVIKVGASNGASPKVITVHSKSPTSQDNAKSVSARQISPTSLSTAQRSQVRGQGSITTGQVSGQQAYSNSNSTQGANIQASSEFLQSLFDQAREHNKHSPTGQLSRTSPQQPVSMATGSQKPQSTKSPQSQKMWSMSSMVPHSSMSSNPAYSPMTSLPKPVPGYQSVALSSLTKGGLHQDSPYLAGIHKNYPNVPTSPLTGQQQNPLANQTAAHQTSDKSRPPHGY